METVIVGGSAKPGWKAVRPSCSARSANEDIAVRMLSHLGHKVRNLDRGYKNWVAGIPTPDREPEIAVENGGELHDGGHAVRVNGLPETDRQLLIHAYGDWHCHRASGNARLLSRQVTETEP